MGHPAAVSWSAERYLRFEGERTRPVWDLLAAVPTETVSRAIDLGCGPGNSTEVLIARFPAARVEALDSSADMVAAARRRLPDIPVEHADVLAWQGEAGAYDVILANAVFQWVDGHAQLFPRLIESLAPGGALAIQMPDNLDEPSHALMRETAAHGPWAERLRQAASARTPIATPSEYYALLKAHCRSVDVWRTIYHHPLANHAAVVAWVEATGLRPFLDPLDEPMREAFKAAYQRRLEAAYPATVGGVVLLPFPRLFIVAVR